MMTKGVREFGYDDIGERKSCEFLVYWRCRGKVKCVREFGYAVIDERKSCGFPVGWRRVVGSWWAMGESWAVEGLQNMSKGSANRIASDHNLMSFSSKPWDPGRKSGGASANH